MKWSIVKERVKKRASPKGPIGLSKGSGPSSCGSASDSVPSGLIVVVVMVGCPDLWGGCDNVAWPFWSCDSRSAAMSKSVLCFGRSLEGCARGTSDPATSEGFGLALDAARRSLRLRGHSLLAIGSAGLYIYIYTLSSVASIYAYPTQQGLITVNGFLAIDGKHLYLHVAFRHHLLS